MTEKSTDYCTRLKQIKPELSGTSCCRFCHRLMSKTGTPTQSGLCCSVEHRQDFYRPSARRINPLKI